MREGGKKAQYFHQGLGVWILTGTWGLKLHFGCQYNGSSYC